MHLVTVTKTVSPGAVYTLTRGSYYTENVNAGEILIRFPRDTFIQEAPNPRPPDDFIPNPNAPQKILVIRPGGYGDLLFLTPVFRALKSNFPLLQINLACYEQYQEALAGNSDIAHFVKYPVPLDTLHSYDAIFALEGVVEDEHKLHAVDRLLDEFGLPHSFLDEDKKRCIYHLTEQEQRGAETTFPHRLDKAGHNVPRLGVQVVASSRCRSYPQDLTAQVCQMLHQRGWEVFFFGSPKSLLIQEFDRLVNLTLRNLTFRQSCAVLSTCDVVLAPDSALVHVAGALEIPTVALYGPFPWQIRTRYNPKTIALQGKLDCAPCFHHVRARQEFPSDGPCFISGRCEALASIPPTRVAAKIDALYRAARQLQHHDHQADQETPAP